MQSSSQEPGYSLWIGWLGDARAASYLQVNHLMELDQLALWNQRLSASFMSDVAHVEIALRNSLDKGLSLRLENQGETLHWSEDPKGDLFGLGGSEFVARLNQAKSRVLLLKGQVNPNDLVAELELGFWIAILGKRFTGLHGDLVSCFHGLPDRNIRQTPIRARRMRKFRNRIAHHHRILHRDLQADWQNIVELASFVHPKLKEFLIDTSETPRLLQRFTQTIRAKSLPNQT